MSLSLSGALFGAAGCKKEIAKDPRLNMAGNFDVEWPPRATTLDDAVAEVQKRIGPGKRGAGSTIEWTAQCDENHCARITLQILKAHPDFQACISGS